MEILDLSAGALGNMITTWQDSSFELSYLYELAKVV